MKIQRIDHKIERDTRRVICRPHIPAGDSTRVVSIIVRILKLDERETRSLLDKVLKSFAKRHKDIDGIFARHYRDALDHLHSGRDFTLSREQKLLVGAYFTMEYAIESAALFNPSIVPHPDQDGLPENSLRFIMSLRAVGEGHISSIVFRSGIIHRDGTVEFEPLSPYVDTPLVKLDSTYDRHLFQLKLAESSDCGDVVAHILDQLPEEFTYGQLKEAMGRLNDRPVFSPERQSACFHHIHWLVNSNYHLDFQPDHELSERVIFPVADIESGGIEDARFVPFSGDDGETTYYATYTAYDGKSIMPQLIETRDFLHFKISTLNGTAVQNKGMALFPRKINGRYAMLSRQDGENNYIMFSQHLHFWYEAQLIQTPCEPWEFIQIGNCGSPIETEEGWLVITHGVGPVREYSIGAILLDLDDPTRLIGRLKSPLLRPYGREREGYVPNVVYTCGAIVHCGQLIMPYSMSDAQAGIVQVGLDELLESMNPV